MLVDLDQKGILIKIVFDGYDFLQREMGRKFISPDKYSKIIATTYLPNLYDGVEEFISYCKSDNSYIAINDYGVGIYNLTDCFDENNPWSNKEYILFNKVIIKSISKYLDINKISFYVCPACNEDGKIYALGFRVLDTNSVMNSFKWLFTCGNNLIYGKNTVSKCEPCYVVEGFRDYVALNELGYNVIGLGSVCISKIQEEYIDTLCDPILLLDNDNFGLKKSLQYKNKYRIATLVGSEEKDAYDTWIKYGNIKIKEII